MGPAGLGSPVPRRKQPGLPAGPQCDEHRVVRFKTIGHAQPVNTRGVEALGGLQGPRRCLHESDDDSDHPSGPSSRKPRGFTTWSEPVFSRWCLGRASTRSRMAHAPPPVAGRSPTGDGMDAHRGVAKGVRSALIRYRLQRRGS